MQGDSRVFFLQSRVQTSVCCVPLHWELARRVSGAPVHYTCVGMSLQSGCSLFASKILAQLSLPLLQPPSRTWLMGIDLEPFKALQQNKGEGRGRELFPVRPGEK